MEQATFTTTSADGASHEFVVYMLPARQALPLLQRLAALGGDSVATFIDTAVSSLDSSGKIDLLNADFDVSAFSGAIKDLIQSISAADDMVEIIEKLLSNTTRDGMKFVKVGAFDLDTFAGNWQELFVCLRHSIEHNYKSFFSGLAVGRQDQKANKGD